MRPTSGDRTSAGGWLWSALLLLLAARGCAAQAAWECVPACKCFWVSGKKAAECKRQNLTAPPDGLSPEIQHLDLSGNQIDSLGADAFTRVRLESLQKLVARECGLRTLDAEAFDGLRPGTFEQTERLRVLLLNRNRLRRIEDVLFHDLQFLQKVELSGNQLMRVGQGSFRNLPNLASLALDGNNLTHLELASFEGLPRLGSLELRDNLWHCDCRLRRFRDWVLQREIVGSARVKCAQPQELAGRAWEEANFHELICGPLPTTTPRVETVGGVDGGKILKIVGSGPIIIIPRGRRIRLEWNDNSTVLNFE